MPPPPSYLDVTSTPFSQLITQAEFNGGTYGGSANQLWIRYIAAERLALGITSDKGGNFVPRFRYFQDDGTTQIESWSNLGGYVVLDAGTYYIKVDDTGGTSINFDFTVQVDIAEVDVVPPVNGLIINDDLEGFPAAIFSITGTFLGFNENIPGGEIGTILPSGYSLWHDRFLESGFPLVLLNPLLQLVSAFDLPVGVGGAFPIITHDDTKFWVINQTNDSVYSVEIDGTIGSAKGPLVASVGGTAAVAAAVTPAGVMYWANTNNDPNIYKFDLINNIALSDLYQVPALVLNNGQIARTPNGHPGDIIRLSDGSIVTWYQDDTDVEDVLIHISSAGALLNSYTFTLDTIDHLSSSPSDPTNIIVWFYLEFGARGNFQDLVLATGLPATQFDIDQFSAGINMFGLDEMFGPSSSCTIVTFFADATPTGGLFQITTVTPTKRNDTINDSGGGTINTAIQAFFETGLFGN